ncbi:ERF family protein [Lysinibacillus sp. KU-BSD001]|uniref:ERF family protein n=1 Tax=Lysinibacillus sp. KU-BSD001 TaxID=3141328 RepID=UPI0036E89105
MIFSESNTNIAGALARSWAAIQTPKHNSKVQVNTKRGGTYTFEYTDLNGILDAVRPIFIENKLTIMQNSYSVVENGHTSACVETMFLHESGEYVKSFPLKFPAAQSMQDFGGQITYMKRYSLAAMLGIATEKDDDANGSSGNDYQYSRNDSYNQSSSYPPAQPAQQNRQESNIDPLKITVPFGPHKGKTLGQIQQEEPNYLGWLAENAQRQDLKNAAKMLAGQMQQQPPQSQQPAPVGLVDAPTMQRLTNVLIPLSEIKKMDADTLYNNSLQKIKVAYKQSNQLSMHEANLLIDYLEQVAKITEGQMPNSKNLITEAQLKALKTALNAAATRTKMDKIAVADYVKMSLQIPAEVESKALTREQASAMIDFINKLPAAQQAK